MVVAAVAAADAVRSGGDAALPDAAPAAATREEALAGAGMSGTLVLASPDCRISALVLPALRSVSRGPAFCGRPLAPPRLPPGCTIVRGERIGGSRATVSAVTAACAPWVSSGLQRRLAPHCPRLAVELLAWARPGRAAAVARCTTSSGRGDAVLAVFEAHRLVREERFPGAALSHLRTSPRGTCVSVRVDGRLVVVPADRSACRLPDELANASAIAWSHDERFAAVAARSHLVLFDLRRSRPRLHRIRVPVEDVAWR